MYHGQFDDSRPRNNTLVTGEGTPAAAAWLFTVPYGNCACWMQQLLQSTCTPSKKQANTCPTLTGKDLRAALDALLAGAPVPVAKPSIGCNLKWHPGAEPEWFGPQQVKK